MKAISSIRYFLQYTLIVGAIIWSGIVMRDVMGWGGALIIAVIVAGMGSWSRWMMVRLEARQKVFTREMDEAFARNMASQMSDSMARVREAYMAKLRANPDERVDERGRDD